jgi:hypothetical protein
MRNFLLGVVVGAAGALWYTQTRGRIDLDRRFGQMQERANQILNESRRILEETRHELGAAFQATKHSVQESGGLNRPGDFGASQGENPPSAS